MKSLSIFALSAAILCNPEPARARLGETLEQCRNRYGDPIEQGGEFTGFLRGEIMVAAHFDEEGRADCLFFRKIQNGAAAPFSLGEIQTLLRANGGDQWERIQGNATALWRGPSGGSAIYEATTGALVIQTAEHATQAAQEAARKTATALSGF